MSSTALCHPKTRQIYLDRIYMINMIFYKSTFKSTYPLRPVNLVNPV